MPWQHNIKVIPLCGDGSRNIAGKGRPHPPFYKGGPGKSICAPIDTFSVMFFLYREVFKIVTKGVAKSAYINSRDEGELTSAGTLHPRPSP